MRKDGKENISSVIKNIAEISDKDYQRRLKKINKTITTIFILSVSFFICLAAYAVINFGPEKFVKTMESVRISYYALAVLVLFAGYAIRFPKWQQYMKKLKVKTGIYKNFAIYLSLYSMDITPGRWGRAVVSYTLNRLTGISFAKTFPAIVADIFTDFLGFAVVLILVSFFVGRYLVVSLVLTALLLIPFFFLFNKKPFDFMKPKVKHIGWLRSFFELGELYFKERGVLGKGEYLYSMFFTIPSVILSGVAVYLVILAFGVNVGIGFLPLVLFFYFSSLIFGMITGVPATLVVTDGVFITYLVSFFGHFPFVSTLGVTSDLPFSVLVGLASTITLFSRIITVWFVEGFGFTALMYTRRYWKDRGPQR